MKKIVIPPFLFIINIISILGILDYLMELGTMDNCNNFFKCINSSFIHQFFGVELLWLFVTILSISIIYFILKGLGFTFQIGNKENREPVKATTQNITRNVPVWTEAQKQKIIEDAKKANKKLNKSLVIATILIAIIFSLIAIGYN